MSYLIVIGISLIVGYSIATFGGVLELFDINERWVKKQHEILKNVINSFFK